MRQATGSTSDTILSWLLKARAAFTLDSKAPTGDYKAFLNGEVRYNSLVRANPERAEKLFDEAETQSKAKYAYLQKLVKLYGADEA